MLVLLQWGHSGRISKLKTTLNSVSSDFFGRIYEYFLMKFAMQGAQDGSESLVQTIVNVIEPDIDISRDVPDIPFWAHESNVDLILLPGKTNK